MKLFKRSAKEAIPSNADKSSMGLPAPALLAVLLGIGAGAVLLWLTLSTQQNVQSAQWAQSIGSSQSAALNQALSGLRAEIQGLASNPALIQALSQNNRPQLEQLERSLSFGNSIIDAHLNRRGEGVQDNQRAAPMSFAGLDLVRRAESGQQPPAEAYRVGNQWMLYDAVSLRQNPDAPVIGSLLLAVDLQRILKALPPLPEQYGQLQVLQKFGSSPAQVLYQRGQAGDEPALTFNTSNRNWVISFTPGPGLVESTPIALPLISLLLAIAGSLYGLYLAQQSLQRRVTRDALQLGQMVKEISAGKNVKAFSLSLPALDTLARSLAQLPQRTDTSAKAETPNPEPVAPKPALSSSDLVNPLFQDVDILDIDILEEPQDFLGLEQPTPVNTEQRAPFLPADIFRAYDIRGVVGDTLTAEYAYWIGRAIGSQSLAQGEDKVIVGRDGRLSGPMLVEQLIQGLVDCGCHVTDIGMVPTPVVYFAANVLEGRSAVMLTGSHNPPDYNGFKIIIAGDTLANEQILALKQRLDKHDLVRGTGSIQQLDVLQQYFSTIRDDIALAKPLRVVLDCGNGAAGVIAPQLIEALGCSVIPMFCDVDGNFPNHHPDPGKPENLKDLISRVKAENADLGLAFDGDGDRVGVVTNTGAIVYPDRLLMLFAKDVVSRNPGADIIFDVKCTRRLTPLISGYGGRPVMWKTGHSLIKKKMKETGALLAGEMSGHIFFKERWYGFDDGIYSAARLLEILSTDKRNAEQVFNAFPSDISTPEINIQVTEKSKFDIVARLQSQGQWGDGNITSIDGVRVDYPKGWGLIRASNTTPVLVLRFEAESDEELERIKTLFREQLIKVAPDLELPF